MSDLIEMPILTEAQEQAWMTLLDVRLDRTMLLLFTSALRRREYEAETARPASSTGRRDRGSEAERRLDS